MPKMTFILKDGARQEVEAPLPPMLTVQPLTPEETAIFELVREECDAVHVMRCM